MKGAQTLHSTQLLKCDRWIKSQNLAKPLPNTSNNTHLICKALPKSMYYGTIILAYHPRRKKAVRNHNPVKALNHSNPSSRNSPNQHQPYDRNPNQCTRCGDSQEHKDLTAQLRSTNTNNAQKLDTSQKCALPKIHTSSHSTIIKISQNRHIKSLYLNILLNSTRTHANVIMMMIL